MNKLLVLPVIKNMKETWSHTGLEPWWMDPKTTECQSNTMPMTTKHFRHNSVFKPYIYHMAHGGRVVRCRTCDREVAGSNRTNGCCVPTPTQRAIPPGSVSEYQRKFRWGVNGHTTRCTSPVSVILRLRLVSGWGLMKRRSAPPHGPKARERTFYIYHIYSTRVC